MIYLIDDKVQRMNGFGWTEQVINDNKKFINAFHIYDQFSEKSKREEIFKDGNVILFHESFFDSEKNRHSKDVNEIRTELENFAKKNPNSIYLSFSGSNDTREFDGNSAVLPVHILYQNLSDFLQFYKDHNFYDIKKLLYGANSELERGYLEKLDFKKEFFDTSVPKIETSENILFIRSRHDIESPFSLKTEVKTLFNKDTSDDRLHSRTLEWFGNKKYDKILIPVSFGQSLSDFNGLRLAAHIRCTNTVNQLTPIFIYSFLELGALLHSNYFNILKTKNVFLIGYTHAEFVKIHQIDTRDFTISELPEEISKLQLEVPNDIGDNHSVANEWGIYQMARSADIDIKAIEGFNINKLNRIYFKWLITKDKLNQPITSEQKTEQTNYSEKIKGLTILGKIDLTKVQKK